MPTNRTRAKSRSIAPHGRRVQIARVAKAKTALTESARTPLTRSVTDRPRVKRATNRVLFVGADRAALWQAAQRMGTELKIGIKRVALSAVVSKYIGETEKNLARLFVAAERSGVILYFDEADALLGKRTEVKDAHDRYANQEVSYLLQRLEDHAGIVILATNAKTKLPLTLRRRFSRVVRFPIPKSTKPPTRVTRRGRKPVPRQNQDVTLLHGLSNLSSVLTKTMAAFTGVRKGR
jgi:SpoVK/Ycf46/Vps4 family AAA+-type ATPase